MHFWCPAVRWGPLPNCSVSTLDVSDTFVFSSEKLESSDTGAIGFTRDGLETTLLSDNCAEVLHCFVRNGTIGGSFPLAERRQPSHEAVKRL